MAQSVPSSDSTVDRIADAESHEHIREVEDDVDVERLDAAVAIADNVCDDDTKIRRITEGHKHGTTRLYFDLESPHGRVSAKDVLRALAEYETICYAIRIGSAHSNYDSFKDLTVCLGDPTDKVAIEHTLADE